MFTVGEFAKLAQVSKRLLRYYDEIEIFHPMQVDPITGHRLYSAEQLSELNRILALKELGLSLDQIRQSLNAQISTQQMQGMLLMKKAEIEQQLKAELERIRKIESRLQVIQDDEADKPLNVVIKKTSAQPVLSTRRIVDDFASALELYHSIHRQLVDKNKYGLGYCICHSQTDSGDSIDMEIGCLLQTKSHKAITLRNGVHMEFRQLPAVEMMATTVVTGGLETLHRGYVDIARWTERNHYRPTGLIRELTLQSPQKADGSDMITEIQIPVEAVNPIS